MRKCTTVIALLFVTILCASAQAQTGLGGIEGFIYDAEGKVIPEAELVISSAAMMGQKTTVASKFGYYRFINLPPGVYTLKVSKDNYQAQEITNISVRAGKTSSFNVTLKVGDFEQVVTIEHNAPIIDLKSPQRSINIDGEFIGRMPLSYDREWEAAWTLVPGTVAEGQFGDRGNRVSVQGADLFQNSWNFEGMNIGDATVNNNKVLFSPDIIEEVQVVTSGFDASIANSQGGYINVVTKSGGNDLSGSAAFYYQPAEWNWSNIEDGDAPEQSLLQPAFSLGGPILQDRAWFFANYRFQNRDEGYGRTADDLALFDAFDLPRPTQNRETRSHQFFGKVTYRLNDSWKVLGIINSDEGSIKNSGMEPNGTDDTGLENESGGQLYTGKAEGAFGENLSFTATISYYNSDNSSFGVGGLNEPSITRYSATRVGFDGNLAGTGNVAYYNNRARFGFGSLSTTERFSFRGDARYFVDDFYGSHEFSFGTSGTPHQKGLVENLYSTPVRVYEARNAEGQWVPFYQLVYSNTQFASIDYRIDSYAGYVQDTWTVNDRLTVTAGLRIEHQTDNVDFDVTELSPNIGFNYALFGGFTDTIRASYGLRHHYLAGRGGDSSLGSGSTAQTEYWDNDLDGTWDVIEDGGTDVESSEANARSWADDIGMPYSHQFQLGYTRVLPYRLQLDLAFVYRLDKNAQYRFNRNLIFENGELAGAVNESSYWGGLAQYINDTLSSRHYQSYEVSLTKEFSDGWQLMGSYSYLSSLHKGEWQPDNPRRYLHPQSWFESPDDDLRPHIFRLAAHTILPWDVTFSSSVTFQSGLVDYPKTLNNVPFFITLPSGSRFLNPSALNTPLFQPRSEDREVTMDNLWIFNVGFGKNFTIAGHQIETQIQAFNLFNSDSYTLQTPNNSVVDEDGNPVGTPRYFWIQPPRAVQWMVKYTF